MAAFGADKATATYKDLVSLASEAHAAGDYSAAAAIRAQVRAQLSLAIICLLTGVDGRVWKTAKQCFMCSWSARRNQDRLSCVAGVPLQGLL